MLDQKLPRQALRGIEGLEVLAAFLREPERRPLAAAPPLRRQRDTLRLLDALLRERAAGPFTIAGLPAEREVARGLNHDIAAKWPADPTEHLSEPEHVLFADRSEPEASGLQWHHQQPQKSAAARFERRKIHQAEIAAIRVDGVTVDPLVVIERVTTAIQNEPVSVDLDRSHVVGGVPMNHIDATFDEPMSECNELLRVVEGQRE
jgi:hypothetical protein